MITPTQDYRRTWHQPPAKLHKGLDAKVNTWIGYYKRRRKVLADLEREAQKIEDQSATLSAMSDHLLRNKLLEFRVQFRRGGRDILPLVTDALAVIREVSDRQVGLRPYPVQLIGALALHRGCLTEMATGEGKTLTAGLAAVLAGWTKRPTHIITVNDYLVRRDEEWIKPIYQFCGVTVGYVTADMKPEERRREYAADVTYTTSKEVLADFLRDRLYLGTLQDPTRRLIRKMLAPHQFSQDGLVMRGLDTAIVDEADSVLIDEAVTPLIISSPHKNEDLREAAITADSIVSQLIPGEDFEVDTRYREVHLSEKGKTKLANLCQTYSGLWRGTDRRLDLIKQALTAREFFHKGKQYVVSNDGKVVIVDEFTGRPMPQRSWRQGLHQAVEAKEGLNISDPTETVARLSFQRFFRLYRRMSGMTGTASEAAEEFWQIYKLPVLRIPTNRPCIRKEMNDRIFADDQSKWESIADEVQKVHETGRPVLVGTRNVANSELLATLLDQRGLSYRLLNAVRHHEEAQIIADAGQKGRITIATNMAGRGTDIKLGPTVAELGGLHVIATERHESGRVDRQLFGRAARQGDPGSSQAFVSVDDELLRRHLHPAIYKQVRGVVKGSLPGKQKITEGAFKMAQNNAQKMAYRQRASVLRTDDWLDEALSFAGPGVA